MWLFWVLSSISITLYFIWDSSHIKFFFVLFLFGFFVTWLILNMGDMFLFSKNMDCWMIRWASFGNFDEYEKLLNSMMTRDLYVFHKWSTREVYGGWSKGVCCRIFNKHRPTNITMLQKGSFVEAANHIFQVRVCYAYNIIDV